MGFKLIIDDKNTGEEGHHIYRSQTPMDPEDLPAPYDTVGPDLIEWEDGFVTPTETYYYRVSAFTASGTIERVSAEVMAVATEGV